MAAVPSSSADTPGLRTSSAASTTAAPAAELRLLLGIRNGVGAGDPGPAVVGGISLPGDSGVDPDDVALAEEPVGGDGRIGQVTVQGPGPELAGRRHHLPDRIDPVRGGAQFEDSAQERSAQVYLADSGPQNRQCVGHRELVEPLRVADACDFVGCLRELRGADHIGRIDPVETG